MLNEIFPFSDSSLYNNHLRYKKNVIYFYIGIVKYYSDIKSKETKP